MFNIASEETYQDGQIIIKEGTTGDWVYVVISGSVEISRMIDGEKFVMSVLRPQEVFGELAFLGSATRTATAQAVGETIVGVMDRAFLDHEYNKLNSEFRAILQTLVERFKKMLDRTSNFSTRKEPRILKGLSIKYKDKKSFVKAYTDNVSFGGLFIKTDNPLNKGDQFMLKLELPDLAESMKLKCEVAWIRTPTEASDISPAGMGVEFVELTKNDDLALKKYLDAIG